MPSAECKPECRICGRPIDTDNVDYIKALGGKIHIECESELKDEE